MNQQAKKILCEAISKIGYWQWWDEADGDFMVEFGGVLLYDETKQGNQARTGPVAICFFGDAFLVILDNKTKGSSFYITLHENEIEPLRIDPETFVFDNTDYAINLLSSYRHRHGGFDSFDSAKQAISEAKVLLSSTCGDYGFIIGGNSCEVQGGTGVLTDNDIIRLSKEWSAYWKDYWKKRNTDEAYEYDYTCENILP